MAHELGLALLALDSFMIRVASRMWQQITQLQ